MLLFKKKRIGQRHSCYGHKGYLYDMTLIWERQCCYLQLVERRQHNNAALVMHLKAFNKGHYGIIVK